MIKIVSVGFNNIPNRRVFWDGFSTSNYDQNEKVENSYLFIVSWLNLKQ